jgi:hypothetical protein
MQPSTSGCVHLSVEAGCGGTTWGLQQARDALTDGMHVVWICQESPDASRFSQMFANVSPSVVSKLHLSEVGENIEMGIESAIGLLKVLSNISLVVVDDWATKTGKTSGDLRKSMQKLIDQCKTNKVSLLVISSAYEDASGGGWKARGSLEGCEIWFLHRCERDDRIRELHLNEVVNEFTISDEGFTPRR